MPSAVDLVYPSQLSMIHLMPKLSSEAFRKYEQGESWESEKVKEKNKHKVAGSEVRGGAPSSLSHRPMTILST